MRKFLCGLLAAALLLTLIPLGGTTTALAATDYSNVRVLLSIGSVNTLTIPVSGSYFIGENGASFKNGTLTVQVSGSKLKVSHSSAGELYTGSTVQIMRESISPSAGYFRLATSGVTRTFLGHLTLKYSGGCIRAVNVVPLPHYLYGVVAYEMSDTFPLEALKAQAVAAKCYVLSGMAGGSDYDIGDTAADQVYKGYNSSYTNVIKAVDATYDVGLYLGTKILRSYFAASNGGQTILPSDAWSGSDRYVWDKAYARVSDPYDVANPFSVQESITIPKNGENTKISAALSNYLRGRAAKTLRDAGYIGAQDTVVFVDSVDELKTSSDSTAKIAMTAVVQYANGSQDAVSFDYSFNLNEFVWNGVMTLAQDLRLFTIEETSKSFTVTRGRYGHGVGLSQRGAQQMANSGWKYDRILNFYYPGASIKSMGITAPVDPEKPADTSNNAGSLGNPIGTAVTTANVNFRAAANTSSTLLGVIPKGATLPIYKQENGFSLVVYGNVTGYVSNSYLTAADAAPPDNGNTGTDTGGKTVVAYGEVTSSTLNFRAAANTSGTIIARLTKGNKIDIYGYVQDSTWYYCSYNGTDGYVSAQYVKLTGTPSTGTNTGSNTGSDTGTDVSGGATGVVLANGISMRSDPSASRGTILARLNQNTQVSVLSTVGDYYLVAVNGQQGYVLKTYVRITSTGSSSGSSNGSTTVQGYGVTTGSVNFRKGAGTGYAIITKLSQGTELTIYGKSNGWYYVSANGQTGYVSSDYVKETQSGSSSSDTSSPSSSTQGSGVTTGSVNLRSGPSTGHTILARLAKGTELTIYGSSNGWYSVAANGKTGYISGDYVKVTSTGSSSTSSGGTPATGKTWSGVVVNEWVRMRSSTDLSSQNNIVGTYDVGTQVTILGQTGDFYLVSVNGKQGYMHKDYVQVTGENASTISGVTSANVYLRQGPGSGYSVLTTLAKGTGLVILGSSGDYYQAQAGSYTGYLVKKYVTVQ